MVDDKFWEVVIKYNFLMRSAIDGPNCLVVCNADCCSIKIDVPKILAKKYIEKGYATKEDFIRSDTFSFKLRFDEEKAKCFLYKKEMNGCSVHNSGIKPPQCWIYPTNFSNPECKEISCKRANGWKIVDSEKTKEAEKLLKYYIFLCQLEAKKEIKNIKNRLNKSSSENNLRNLLKEIPPSQLAGFKDTWDYVMPLPAQGVSLQMKKFCSEYNKNCDIDFLKCTSVCEKVYEGLLEFLQQILLKYVQKNPDSEGEYSFLKLTSFSKN
ncbi:MAG: hypothetical protein ACFE9X_11410 [Promethearchaeota archaeon]